MSSTPRDDRWSFTEYDLAHSPSIVEDYVPRPIVDEALSKACLVIQRTASHLFGSNAKTQSRNISSVAMIMLHRFYMRQSLHKHDRYKVAGAALFAAAKAEEVPKKLAEFVKAFNQVLHLRSDQNEEMGKQILLKERILLNTLEFDFDISLPYPTISECLKAINNKWKAASSFESNEQKENLKKVASLAHMLAYDCIRIGLPLIYSAEELGVACVTIASKMMSLDVASEDTQIISNCSGCVHCTTQTERLNALIDKFLSWVEDGLKHRKKTERQVPEGSPVSTPVSTDTPVAHQKS